MITKVVDDYKLNSITRYTRIIIFKSAHHILHCLCSSNIIQYNSRRLVMRLQCVHWVCIL
jgi:hypothetical protein